MTRMPKPETPDLGWPKRNHSSYDIHQTLRLLSLASSALLFCLDSVLFTRVGSADVPDVTKSCGCTEVPELADTQINCPLPVMASGLRLLMRVAALARAARRGELEIG